MFVKPLIPLLKDQMDPTTMSYLGCVEDNKDPEKLGRVKVRVAPYNDLATEELPWASPVLGTHGNTTEAGGLNVPELGAQVRVTFPSRDFTAPYYSGAELTQFNRTTFFDEDYPDTYGYKDSIGNFAKINKAKGTAIFQHASSTNIQVTPNGSIQINLSNGAYFLMDYQNNFEINIGALSVGGSADGSLLIDANNEIKIKGDINIDGNVSINGDFTAKGGASGTFMTLGNFVTVKNGLIVSIK